MLSTAQDVYNEIVRALSPTERLRLATLILNELAPQNSLTIDQSDEWTEQDQAEVISFSLQYADSLFPNEEDV